MYVAAKLKACLLKPSVLLSLGTFLAGSHHLKFLLTTLLKTSMKLGTKISSTKTNKILRLLQETQHAVSLTYLNKFQMLKI